MAAGSNHLWKPRRSKFSTEDAQSLIAFCKQEFELSGGGANSLRAKLEQVEKQTGKRPKELDELVEFPASMMYQWSYFIALHNKRSSNGFGINPISYTEMQAYFNLIGYRPEEWEIDLISKLDSTVLQVHSEQQEKESKKKK